LFGLWEWALVYSRVAGMGCFLWVDLKSRRQTFVLTQM
jgi:hypothetical protein